MEIKDYPVVARWRLFTNKPSAPAGNYTVAETIRRKIPQKAMVLTGADIKPEALTLGQPP